MNFGYKRNLLEVPGFYIVFSLFLMLLGGLSDILLVVISGASGENAIEMGRRRGVFVGLFVPLIFSFLILYKKNLLTHVGYLLLVFLGRRCLLLKGTWQA